MASMSNSKCLRLIGKLITPIVISKPIFFVKGCKITITKNPSENERGYLPYPKKIHYGKLVKGIRKAPTIKSCYQGFVVVDFPGENNQAKKKLQWFFSLESLGAHHNEGMGKIKWLEFKEITRAKKQPLQMKLKIRKGLGHHPKPLQLAIKALLLHDFVHTEKHESKIYQEVEINNRLIREACKNHHNGENSNNWLIPIIKKYDGKAAFLNRRIPRREERRYDYENGEIDCKEIAKIITEKQNNIYELYNYVYYDKTFDRFFETIDFTNNKLRNHLLLMTNLLINDFKKGKLAVQNNKLVIVSTSAKEKERIHSELKMLKRIYPSKKEAGNNNPALQEPTAKDKNHPINVEKNYLRWDI